MDKKNKKQLSKKAKILLSLSAVVLVLFLLVFGIWFGGRMLFQENDRFIIREVELQCQSGYWSGKDEEERIRKTQEFARLAKIECGRSNTFSLDLRQLRAGILQKEPEIRDITIRRQLPDLLLFGITPRIPRADTGYGYYLDEEGYALLKAKCPALEKSLPVVSCPNLNNLLVRGKKVEVPSILLALRFITMLAVSEDSNYREIELKNIMEFRKHAYIQCEFTYKGNPKKYTVKFSSKITDDQLNKDITKRLIPYLENSLLHPELSRVIDLRFEGAAYSPGQ